MEELLIGLLPTLGGALGSAVGGPLGGSIGSTLGSLGQMGIGAAMEAGEPPPNPSRVDTSPEAPGAAATGLRFSAPRPEQVGVPGGGTLATPPDVRSQVEAPLAQGLAASPTTQGITIDRSRRIELLQELLRELRNE